MRFSLALALCIFVSTCNAFSNSEYEENDHDEKYINPKLNWVYWYADYNANSNQAIVKTDFSKIVCHLTQRIAYWS